MTSRSRVEVRNEPATTVDAEPRSSRNARALATAGAVGGILAALLPWTTFILNDGPFPAKASLQFFDAPFALEGFRLHVALLGVVALLVAWSTLPSRHRILRGLGAGMTALSALVSAFIVAMGGGIGALTTTDEAVAYGGVIGIVAGVLIMVAASAGGVEPVPVLAVPETRPWAYAALLGAYAVLLWTVAETVTAGGVTGAYSGAIFLAFVAFLGGVFAAMHAAGLLRWVSQLSERHRAFSIAVLLGAAVLLPFTEAGSDYWMRVAVNIGIYAATAIGLNIVVGLAGLLDIGYVAFLGIGALVAANLSGAAAARFDIELPFVLVLVFAAVAAGLLGAIVGSPTLRVRGDYLAIVTLAFGEIFRKVAQNDLGGLTNGANGIYGVPPISFLGTDFNQPLNVLGIELPSGVLYYLMIVVLIAAVMAIFGNLKNSRVGRAWIAVREDEDAARAMGIKTGKVKILAFLVGATLAGAAGSIFAHSTGTVAYDSFQFMESVTLLAAVVLGGMGTIPGAVLGASLLFVLPEKLRDFEDYRLMLFGLALVLIMRFRPQGLVPDRVRRAEPTEFAGRPGRAGTEESS